MDVPTIRGARRAAKRLRGRYPGLTYDVEDALQGDATRRPDQYLDVTSVASLVVSVASLTWQVYNDLKTPSHAPEPDAVERDVTNRLDPAEGTALTMSRADLEQVIHIVVTETLNTTAEPDHPEEHDKPLHP